MTEFYQEDLAYIHDVGFQDYALKSAPGMLEIFQQHDLRSGLIVDLGCGSGRSAEILAQRGYQVLGIDISTDMIAIARKRVPTAEFRVESAFTADIPPCTAVIAIGECFSYLFDENSDNILNALWQRVYRALPAGGIFIFDVVIPGHVAPGETLKSFTEGDDWIVMVEKQEDPIQQVLTRRIISLRQIGDRYRRSDETHRQRLFDVATLCQALQHVGFQVETTSHYGQFPLLPARAGFIATKPIE
jgi:SAM-dependent methyltransferase